MTITPHEEEAFVRETVSALRTHRITAHYWHSGGGIMGLQIEVPGTRSTLFGTLKSDGPTDLPQWVDFDLNDSDGEFIASITLNQRPIDSTYVGAPDPTTPASLATELISVLSSLGVDLG